MLYTSAVAVLANVDALKPRVLPMPAIAYGGIALAAFLALLGVLWTFRNTAAKYDRPGPGAGS
ncbi:MAG: hypothetical protein ABI662_10370 [Dermatophilaceae bacterium]